MTIDIQATNERVTVVMHYGAGKFRSVCYERNADGELIEGCSGSCGLGESLAECLAARRIARCALQDQYTLVYTLM